MGTLVQFGAGNIGRSFVAQLFARAGYEVVFVDVVDELVTQLNAKRRYRVMIVDTESDVVWVEGVRAVHGKDVAAVAETLAEADMAATSVGPNALPFLYPAIAQGLQLRYARYGLKPLDIILAENLRNAASIVRAGLRQHLPADFPLDAMVGLVETSIGKMVPIMTEAQRHEDPLWVFAEAYNQLILDARAFLNPIPPVPGLVPKANITAYVDRKLFIHNLGHAAVAYLGYLHDPALRYIWQVTGILGVRDAAEAAMRESARALLAAYPDEFTEATLAEHIDDLLRRFTNRALGDTVYRVGRDLLRKLSREDRVIGAMLFAAEHGVASPATARVAAAAMAFRATDECGRTASPDAKFADEYYPAGLETVLTRVCGLDLAAPADAQVAAAIRVAHEGQLVGSR
ncbi:MAG TPA: mannitol-1-phosphate 5-dehydrogenase [Armatimonadota bacterium]|jgi:mannitol-1-phosphate 5-dehydrogenase